jgi:hypothetical protein
MATSLAIGKASNGHGIMADLRCTMASIAIHTFFLRPITDTLLLDCRAFQPRVVHAIFGTLTNVYVLSAQTITSGRLSSHEGDGGAVSRVIAFILAFRNGKRPYGIMVDLCGTVATIAIVLFLWLPAGLVMVWALGWRWSG